jgi:hypothetical protein
VRRAAAGRPGDEHHRRADAARPFSGRGGWRVLSPGLAALIYGLARTSAAGGFGSAEVLVPALAGAALLAVFVWHALRTSEPLIDLVSCSRRRASAPWS